MSNNPQGNHLDKRWPKRTYRLGTEPDPRFTLANERTFLAWIRTSLAFIAGGIALSAFPLSIDSNVRQLLSVIALTVGALIALWAWISWTRIERSMRQRSPLPSSPALFLLSGAVLAVAVTATIAFL